MMNRMLGFFACCPAVAGDGSGSAACMDQPAPISAAVAASSDEPIGISFRFMNLSFCLVLLCSFEGLNTIPDPTLPSRPTRPSPFLMPPGSSRRLQPFRRPFASANGAGGMLGTVLGHRRRLGCWPRPGRRSRSSRSSEPMVTWSGGSALSFCCCAAVLGRTDFEARGNERVFLALGAGAARGQGEQRDGTEDSERSEDLLHGFLCVGVGFSERSGELISLHRGAPRVR